MATYVNQGALWPNDYKTTDNQPDVRGNVKVEVGLIEELLDLAVDGQVEISLSGWYRDYQGKEFTSLKASKPYVKEEASPRGRAPAPRRAAPAQPTRRVSAQRFVPAHPDDDPDDIPFN